MPALKKHIDENVVDDCRRLGMTWVSISKHCNVSYDTMLRWRQEINYAEPLEDIDDASLDQFILDVKNPLIGEVTVMGRLTSAGYSVTRERVRESVMRVDPEGRDERRKKKLKRREYNVSGPHALWHMDGHHKLIKWKIITHGGIDGYSRFIVFLKAVDNNKAKTVLSSFLEGVRRIGKFPSRIRGDYGTENVLVADAIIDNNGINRNSFICGKSVHNQRIERLWKDYYESVTSVFVPLFTFFEESRIFDVESDDHIFCLHFLFLPVLNKKIEVFRNGWNNHKIRTEHSRSPLMILLEHENISAEYPINVDVNEYGIEGNDDDEYDDDEEELNQVILESKRNPFTENQYEIFLQRTIEFIIHEDDNDDEMLEKLRCVIRVMNFVLRNFN
jgi:hypothetical protein